MLDESEGAEVIVGTYEDYVVGYRVQAIETNPKKRLKSSDSGDQANGTSDKQRFSLDQTFAVRAHSGSVRCLAASSDGSLALSAGIDEVVNLFGLKKRKLLQTTEGAFNCVAFVGRSHIICGSDDANIYIYQIKNSTMNLVKTLKGHKQPVTTLSVHPSGKLLLSISKDNSMITWNLIKGRRAYVTTIKVQAHLVRWSRSEQGGFMIAANNEVYSYNNSGILEHNIKLDKRVNSIEFLSDTLVVIASDSGFLEFFDLTREDISVLKFQAHESRIKIIKCLGSTKLNGRTNCGGDASDTDEHDQDADSKQKPKTNGAQLESSSKVLFVTASSDGLVKLWMNQMDSSKPREPKELARVDTGARLTCMTTT